MGPYIALYQNLLTLQRVEMKTAYRLLAFATLLFVIVATPAQAGNQRHKARLCSNCAFGSKVQNCVKCGKWAPSQYTAAYICDSCAFGSKSQYCVKCGKWAPSHYTDARLCSSCSFGSKKNNCVKCGKWIP